MYLFKCIELAVGVIRVQPLIYYKRNILNVCSRTSYLILLSSFSKSRWLSLQRTCSWNTLFPDPRYYPPVLYLCRWDALPLWSTLCARVSALAGSNSRILLLAPFFILGCSPQSPFRKLPGLLGSSPSYALWRLEGDSITQHWKCDGKWNLLYQERKHLHCSSFQQESSTGIVFRDVKRQMGKFLI